MGRSSSSGSVDSDSEDAVLPLLSIGLLVSSLPEEAAVGCPDLRLDEISLAR